MEHLELSAVRRKFIFLEQTHKLMNKHSLTILILLFILIICTSCTDHDYISLGDHYIYRSLSGGNSYIFNTDYLYRDQTDTDANKPTNKDYYGSLIPCAVKDYSYDEQFIVANQVNNPNCFDSAIREDALKTGNSINYWIVVKNSRKTIGPLTLEEYRVKRQEYNVPDSLKLDEQ
ncbi:MAG: DUF3997 domain-containing protein [Thermoleophilia bacterium]